ncbi:MoaB/Mog domain-containing protein [Lyophyllum atratum]|nr:MoaB/Mog domain-containing protein [Lyophyllum atratum]
MTSSSSSSFETSTTAGTSSNEPMRFHTSPVVRNPLGEGRHIRTAAALIIGDEILNGKTLDRNSNFFARYCFEQGIDLKRIEVIADDEQEIIEASRRMVKNYDFVITTGGIGPTHDDITYAALAKSFDQSLVHHPETLRRIDGLSKNRNWAHANAQQREAAQRMALFPEHAEIIFVGEDIWVPVIRMEGRLCVFPGIPSLFQRMLTGLTPFLPLPPQNERPLRIQVFTDRPESMIAPYLTTLQERLKPRGIQVGSYPVLGKGVFVSLIGRDLCGEGVDMLWLADVAREVEKEVGGHVVSDEEIAQKREEGRETRDTKEGKAKI